MYQDNPIIKKRFEEKLKRYDKTALSILVSWAINNVVASLSESEKEKKWAIRFKLIQKRYSDFIDEYRAWMLENMPIENPKITYEDIKEATEEAPKSQAQQDLADTLKEGKIKEEENIKQANLESEVAYNQKEENV